MPDHAATRDPLVTGARRHRRIAYRLHLTRPFRHDEDTDLIDGVYRDAEGTAVGRILMDEGRQGGPNGLLVIPDEEIPLMHVEESFELDHRIAAREQVIALLYRAGEAPTAGVRESGDRWDDGELVVYTFESDDEALTAQQYTMG